MHCAYPSHAQVEARKTRAQVKVRILRATFNSLATVTGVLAGREKATANGHEAIATGVTGEIERGETEDTGGTRIMRTGEMVKEGIGTGTTGDARGTPGTTAIEIEIGIANAAGIVKVPARGSAARKRSTTAAHLGAPAPGEAVVAADSVHAEKSIFSSVRFHLSRTTRRDETSEVTPVHPAEGAEASPPSRGTTRERRRTATRRKNLFHSRNSSRCGMQRRSRPGAQTSTGCRM